MAARFYPYPTPPTHPQLIDAQPTRLWWGRDWYSGSRYGRLGKRKGARLEAIARWLRFECWCCQGSCSGRCLQASVQRGDLSLLAQRADLILKAEGRQRLDRLKGSVRVRPH